MGTNEKKMTTGSPGKLIITFAIPLMLGNILQQFYTMADTMIVGQVVGVEALAAVGAGDWLVWLVFGIMTGITQGFSILVAQFYGAREKENLKCAVAKSYIMTALLSVIVLAVSEGAVYHVLLFLQTPDNVIDLTMLYLRLIFAGIPIIAAYNIFAAILRALVRQHVGQEGREFGRVDEGGRVGGQFPPFDAPCEETAQGRNAPRERAGRVAAFAQPSDEQRDVFVV